MVQYWNAGAALGVGVSGFVAFGQAEPVSPTPPNSVRYQLIVSGSSFASLDFNLDCIPSIEDVAIHVYLTLRDKGLLAVDTDGDGELTGNDTIMQIRGLLAASVADPDMNGATDGADVAAAADDAVNDPQNPGSDVTQDSAVNGGDLIAISGQIGRENVVDFERAADMIFASIGRVTPGVDAGTFGWHTVRTSSSCGGFGGDNWPDDDNHYTRTSQNYPPTHDNALSRLYPGNHMVSVSASWPEPDCSSSSWPWGEDRCEWADEEDEWPANHSRMISGSWSDGPREHNEVNSFQWRHRPDHWYGTSSSWGPEHDMEISSVWPSGHAREFSEVNWGNHPEGHHEAVTGTWQGHPVHFTSVSAMWPPNHRKHVSDTWGGGHGQLFSVLWPATHVRTTSQGWPLGVPPRSWPPNHNGPVSLEDTESLPPMPMDLLPPDHTYFTTVRDVFSVPMPGLPWPPAMGGDGDGDGGCDGCPM